MANSAVDMYAQSIDQCVNAIKRTGNKRTILVQGHMGTGKSSILKMLEKELPTHTPCYFDCTTKDLGDITIPKLVAANENDNGYVQYLTNEELGAHLNKPIILMFDEWGKALLPVQNASLRIMLERQIGSYTLHPDSIVFATTNLGAEGVGDLLKPHHRNRIIPIKMRKPTNIEHIEWGVNNGIVPEILGWEKDNPQLFASHEDVKDPDENPWIYHPQAQRAAFFTPRSAEAASDVLKQRDHMDDSTVTALLMGAIGERGAMDLMAFVKLADQLPSLESIKSTPETAKVPESASAVCMVVYRALSTLDKTWITSWMKYVQRLDKEAQALFANGVRAPKYSKQSLVMTNKLFTEWAMANNYMFAADKK